MGAGEPQGDSPDPGAIAKKRFGAFVIAHVLAYPIAGVWAAGAVVPLLARMTANAIATSTPEDVARKVLLELAGPSIALFVVVHLAAIPWMRAPGGRRGMVATLAILGLALLLGAVFAAGTWLWLFLK